MDCSIRIEIFPGGFVFLIPLREFRGWVFVGVFILTILVVLVSRVGCCPVASLPVVLFSWTWSCNHGSLGFRIGSVSIFIRLAGLGAEL